VRPVLTPAEGAELDRGARERGIQTLELMERAGRETARIAAELAGGRYGRRAVVVCGRGNNGGDGLVAARYLASWGLAVAVVLLEPGDRLEGAPRRNLDRLTETRALVRAFEPVRLARELARADVAVDAIFGTGFHGTPEGAAALAIQALHEGGAEIVAVDVPSGVNGETGSVEGAAVRADATVTFGAWKPGLLLFPGAEHAGIVEVVDIGFPEDLVRSDLRLVEPDDVAEMLPHREPDTHKRASGVVLVVGGSRTMTGAVTLAASSAYRVGAGLVRVAVPGGILPVVQGLIREATFVALPETAEGTALVDPVLDGLEDVGALALGPGMTTNEETAEAIRALVRSSPVPIVLDADGLNAFAGRAAQLSDRRAELILTPHAGEFGRLAGMASADVGADRVGNVRKLAAETGATVLLKGSRTLIGTPDGVVRINPTGGPFLATGGTGDVLTGAIAGLLARRLEPADAATAAAYVHGLAGSRAGSELGEGATAGDVLDHLAAVTLEVRGA
jgi:ADP-dependent NAD(P)H-hydrate dehydratase / NAD(P)H-hydrate epimerase